MREKQLLSDNAPLLCLFSYGTKQGRVFSAKDNKLPMALFSEKRNIDHIHGGNASTSAAAFLCI